MAVDPEILLMDEPFGALDAQTRERLHQELLRVHSATNKTVVFVTHDLDEAVYLADRIMVLSARPGRLAGIILVGLSRPRPPAAEAKSDPEFAVRRREVWDLINVGGSVGQSEEELRR